jgi:hypothetical protein
MYVRESRATYATGGIVRRTGRTACEIAPSSDRQPAEPDAQEIDENAARAKFGIGVPATRARTTRVSQSEFRLRATKIRARPSGTAMRRAALARRG